MTAYTNIQANTQASEPLTTTVVTALDRNLYALFEGDSTATPFAQLQEPAIQTAAINPAKFAPVTAPTSTATGIYTNAACFDALGLYAERDNSSYATHSTETKTINRSGSYTFYFSSELANIGTNDYRTKSELIIDGVVRFTHTQNSSIYTARNQVTIAITGGEEYLIKNYYVSGSASGGFSRARVQSQCLVMISVNTCMNQLEIDMGLLSTFNQSGSLELRLGYLNHDPNNITQKRLFGNLTDTYWLFEISPTEIYTI